MSVGQIHLSSGTEEPSPNTPVESLLFAYAAMVPLLAGTVCSVVLRGAIAVAAMHLTAVWAGVILCFLAGVRRGLSFRQTGGPLLSQIAGMLWLFALGVTSLVSPWLGLSLALQILGYASVAVLDPIAARRGEAPRYFGRLRPVQMAIPIVCLFVVALKHVLF